MAQFHLKLTEGGVALLAKAAAGKPLSFQKMVMGDGNYSGDPAAMEAVISPKKELSIYRLSRNGNKVSVRSVLTLNQVTAPFWWRELGLYAADPDGGGLVLAAYGNAMDKADYIAAGGVLEERIVDVSLMVDTAAQVTAEASGVVFAGEEAFQSHKGDRAVHVTMLTHVRSSSTKVHTLSGLGSVSGVFACQFKATAAFVTGDTFRVNGATYAVKLQNGEDAEDNLFVSGALVSCIIDTAGKTVNFRAGGAGQLKKYAAGSVTLTMASNKKGSGTVSGLDFTPQVILLSNSYLKEQHQFYIKEKDHVYWHDLGNSTKNHYTDDAATPFSVTKDGFQVTDLPFDTYYANNWDTGKTLAVSYWCYG